VIEQRLRRLRIGAQGGLAGAEDAGFLEADALAIRPSQSVWSRATPVTMETSGS
jgi:hypothetical protein